MMQRAWLYTRSIKRTDIKICCAFIVIVSVICVSQIMKMNDSPKASLATNSYLQSWRFPRQQLLPLPEQYINQIRNPGCDTPRRLHSYHPPQNSTYQYYHPSLVHFAKIFPDNTPHTISFKEYISMLSYYRNLKPKRIVVHTNGDISGLYWNKAQQWNGTQVVLNKVETIKKIQGKSVIFLAHVADYIKISQVLEHGGIATDFDVIFINRDQYEDRSSRAECILTCENKNCTKINAGFYSCAKNSLYMLRWLKSYHEDYQPWEWVYNSGDIPTSLLVNSTSFVCHNIFVDDTISGDPNFFDAPKRWLVNGGVDWRTKTAAHYYLRYVNLPNNQSLLRLNNSFGDMLRHVIGTTM